MAEFTSRARPGVTVTTSTPVASPTVNVPTLQACVVGPCYQVLSPTTSEGALNSDAVVQLPAVVRSATQLGSTVSLSGKTLALSVNGTRYSFSFPTTIAAAAQRTSLVPSQILAAVPVITAELVDDYLVLSTVLASDSASIRLHNTTALGVYSSDLNDTLVALGLDGFAEITIAGASRYDNFDYTIPFASVPTPANKASAQEITLSEDGTSVYRFYRNGLVSFDKDSAVNWNKIVQAPTKVNNTSISTYYSTLTPTTEALVAVSTGNSLTDRAFHPGRTAEVYIPLANETQIPSNYTTADTDISGISGVTPMSWPDVTGTCYLRVRALGIDPFLADQTAAPGPYIGTLGNALKVTFTASGSASVGFSGSTLTINLSSTTTYAQLEALLVASTSMAAAMTYDLGDGAGTDAYVDPDGALTGKTFYLGGGVDPVDFSADLADKGGSNQGACVVVGGVEVPSTLDSSIVNQIISVSVDGGAYVDVTIPSTRSALVTALAAIDGMTCTTASIPCMNTATATTWQTGTLGSFTALVLRTDSQNGHDSTIKLKASSNVLSKLFTGTVDRYVTSTLSARELVVTAGDLSASSRGYLDRAIQPGSLRAVMDGYTVSAHFACEMDASRLTAFTSLGSGIALVLKHSAFSSGSTRTLTVDFSGDTTASDVASSINTAIAADTGLDTYVEAVIYTPPGGNAHLVLRSKTTTLGQTLQITSATSAALINAWGSANLPTGSVRANSSSVITVTDTGDSNNVVATTDLTWALPATMSVLDDASGAGHESGVYYAGGHIDIHFETGLVTNPGSVPVTVSFKVVGANAFNQGITTAGVGGTLDFSSAIFTGPSSAIVPGDKLYNTGLLKGAINAVQDFVIVDSGGTTRTFTGAQVVLAAASMRPGDVLANWYVRAMNLADAGGDRPAPELEFDATSKELRIKQALNRGVDGIPLNQACPVYMGYTALRTDVTATATRPAILRFGSLTDLDDAIGPITPNNPLAWGVYSALSAAPSTEVYALGVDDVSANEPDGTALSYARAFELLTRTNVFSVVPLTQRSGVHELLIAHVAAMKSEGKIRSAIVCPIEPTEALATTVASGSATIADGDVSGDYELTFSDTTNFVDSLAGLTDANGDTIANTVGSTYDAVDGIYLTRAGDGYRYLVTGLLATNKIKISTTNLAFMPGYGPGENANDDAFYHTSAPDEFAADGEVCSVFIRQEALDTSTPTGRAKVMNTLANICAGYGDASTVAVGPAAVGMTYGGQSLKVPGYYLACVVAGLSSYLNPSEGITNRSAPLITATYGSLDKFTDKEVGIAAAGGMMWFVQDTAAGPVYCRQQLTTDMTSVYTREWSIVRTDNAVRVAVANVVKPFTGRYNIDAKLLAHLGRVLTALGAKLKSTMLKKFEINSISQNVNNPEKVDITFSIGYLIPCNDITITMSV